jgi:hypothetical protein
VGHARFPCSILPGNARIFEYLLRDRDDYESDSGTLAHSILNSPQHIGCMAVMMLK